LETGAHQNDCQATYRQTQKNKNKPKNSAIAFARSGRDPSVSSNTLHAAAETANLNNAANENEQKRQYYQSKNNPSSLV
jgi:hypothetical protein